MKANNNKKYSFLTDLTPQEAALINGGKHGADDGSGHDVGDDKGGRGRGKDDGPNHT